MQIVIDIDSYVLEHCKRHVEEHYANNIEEAIADGVVLPKGHGNLKDEDEIYELLNTVNGTAELDKAFEAVKQANTIIKAESEG